MSNKKDLHIRVELTGEDQHTLILDSREHFQKHPDLTLDEVRQHIDTELDSWRQRGRDEKRTRDGEPDPSQNTTTLEDNTRQDEEGS